MDLIKTSNTDFNIYVDHYPYSKTIDSIKRYFTDWFEFKKKQKIDISNYDLESDASNSLLSSFRSKLKDGNFTFLYFKDTCLGFCGLQIDNEYSWQHRLFTNPTEYVKHLGRFSQYIIPYQIQISRLKGCRYYQLTFNGKNERFYYFYKNKKYLLSKFYNQETISGVINLSKFEYIGYHTVNHTKQLVARLDLQRNDIDDFCQF